MQLTIKNNSIKEPSHASGSIGNALQLNIGTNTGNTNYVCADISSNDIAGGGNNVNFGEEDFRLRQRQSTTIRLPGYSGPATDLTLTPPAVVAFVKGQNTGSPTGSATVSGSGGGFVGGAACTLPSP